MRVVICGGGVIGASVAYYLSRRGADIVVVERTAVACAASGKSGGFLALDWCDGSPLGAVARRSFELHARLPEELDLGWGYRRMTTYGGSAVGRPRTVAHTDLGWLSEAVSLSGRLGSSETTAQVDPGAFTRSLMQAAQTRGAELRIGEVTGIERRGDDGAVTGVRVGGDVAPCDAVVVAMGPWSILAAQWLPLPAIYALKGHSLVFEPDDPVPAEAVFLEYREDDGALHAPEIFPRRDGSVYVCAISSDSALPFDPADVAPDPGAIERLSTMCRDLSPVLAAAKVRAAQACYRPMARDGLPLIGKIPGIPGAYVATAHSVWGILNAPATGEAMADLILDGAARRVDLSAFDPGRLPALDPNRIAASRAR